MGGGVNRSSGLLLLALAALAPVWAFYIIPKPMRGVDTHVVCHPTRYNQTSPASQFSLRQRLWRKLTRKNDTDFSHVEADGYNSDFRGGRLVRTVKRLFRTPKPGTLILIRHGESQLNYNKTFTGWIDSDLNERGIKETEHAARLLLEQVRHSYLCRPRWISAAHSNLTHDTLECNSG